MIRYLLESPFVPLIAWTLAIALLVQIHKQALRAAKVRHHPWAERTLPLVPVGLGVLTALAFPHAVGLPAVVSSESVPRLLASLYGAGVGFASSGAFQAVRALLPESAAKPLTIPDEDGA